MTYATMHRNFNPERSPLAGVAAVAAAALTLGVAVLLPTQLAPTQARTHVPLVAAAPAAVPAAVPMVAVEAPVQIVRMPVIEITATRTTEAAASRYNVPAVYKQKG